MPPLSESLETLAQQGWEHIHAEEFEEAQQIGKQLVEQNALEGYRILGELYRQMEEPEQGLNILEQGTKAFPQDWEILLDYGNLLSEAGQPKEAIEAYKKAKAIPDAPDHWLDINHAAARFKLGEIDEALTQLQQIKVPEAIGEAFLMQLNILEALNRFDLIIEIAEEELEAIPMPENEEAIQTMSNICTKVATAAHYEEKEAAMIEHYVWQGLYFFRENEDALWLLRELRNEYSDQSRMYVLLVSGDFALREGETEIESFMTSYGIIADDLEEAMEMIKAFETKIEEVDPNSLEIVEVDEGENEDQDAKGLYFASGFGVLEAEEGQELE